MLHKLKERWQDLLSDHPRLEAFLAVVRPWVPPVNFITIHYAYFIVASLVSSAIFWGSSSSTFKVEYIDSLLLVISSLTGTGIATINLSQITTWQQVLLWICFIIGSSIWVSWWTVMTRKHFFEKRFDDIVQAERERRKRASAASGPAFRQFLSFEKFKSSPPAAGAVLTGLGTTLQPISEQGEKKPARPRSPSPVPPRRTFSAPQGLNCSDSEDNASKTTAVAPEAPATPRDRITFAETPPRLSENRGDRSIYQHSPNPQRSPDGRRPSTANSAVSKESDDFFSLRSWKKILGDHNVSKRGQFYDLSSEEREVLGGCEYRALKILSIVVPLYGFLWQGLCALALGAWIANHAPDVAAEFAVKPWWAGIFMSVSAFNNAGMSLIDTSMVPFQGAYFVLIVVASLVVAGNTGYPLFLRASLWSILQFLRLTTAETAFTPWKETIEFILKYPRRVYTTMFPSRATWWLLTVVVTINTVDWLAFEVFNIGNDAVTALPVSHRIIAGWFQAIVVRAAGFTVTSISTLYPAVQLLYMIMMYVAVYPVTITMRHSNVYEERSLGIYEDDPATVGLPENNSTTQRDDEPKQGQLRRRKTAAIGNTLKRSMTMNGVGVQAPSADSGKNSRVSFVQQQIRGQLAHDLWWLVLPTILITIIETDHYLDQPLVYSIFNIMFEVISGYACVGLSVGLPNQNYSFSGGWHPGSKFILCLIMLRGRHRGLPVAVDKAVRLPKEELHQEEDEDSRIRRTMTMDRIASRDMR